MVNLDTQWALTYTTIDPRMIALAFGESEDDCWQFLVELQLNLREAEQAYQSEWEERRVNLQEFIDEIPNKKEIKRLSLLEKLHIAKKLHRVEDVKRLLAEVKAFLEPSTVITTYEILKAKGFAIRTLLKVDRPGNISCPFHPDRNPSFQITKKNTFSCHSCGAFGDVIDLYMKVNSCDFKTAVRALQ